MFHILQHSNVGHCEGEVVYVGGQAGRAALVSPIFDLSYGRRLGNSLITFLRTFFYEGTASHTILYCSPGRQNKLAAIPSTRVSLARS